MLVLTVGEQATSMRVQNEVSGDSPSSCCAPDRPGWPAHRPLSVATG